jgi:hypothetical protein
MVSREFLHRTGILEQVFGGGGPQPSGGGNNGIHVAFTAAQELIPGQQDITTPDLMGQTPVGCIAYMTGVSEPSMNAGFSGNVAAWSMGATDGANQWSIAISQQGGGSNTFGARTQDDSMIMRLLPSGLVSSRAEYVSFIPNGIRINWTNRTINDREFLMFVFIVGDDANFEVGVTPSPGTGGNNVSTGFEPEVVMIAGMPQIGIPGNSSVECSITHGVSHNTGSGYDQKCFATGRLFDGSLTSSQRDGSAAMFWQNEVAVNLVELDNFTANSFRIISSSNSTNSEFGYIAMSFGGVMDWEVGRWRTPALTGSDSKTGVGFQPDAVIFGGGAALENLVDDTQGGFITGVMNNYKTPELFMTGYAHTGDPATGPGTNNESVGSFYNRVAFEDALPGPRRFEGNFSGMESDGWTVDWSTAEQTDFWYLAARDSSRPAFSNPGNVMRVVRSLPIDSNVFGSATQDIVSTELGGQTPVGAIFFFGPGTAWNVGREGGGTTTDYPLTMSIGAADGTNQWCTSTTVTKTTNNEGQAVYSSTTEIIAEQGIPWLNASLTGSAEFDSFIPGGVRINWTNAPSQEYLLTVILIAGPNANVDVGVTGSPTTGGTSVSTGFEPEAVIAASIPYRGIPASNITDFALTYGISVRDGVNYTERCWAVGRNAFDYTCAFAEDCAGMDYDNGRDLSVNIDGFTSSGFVITESSSESGREYGYVAISFNGNGQWDAGTWVQPNSTGEHTVTDVPFTPDTVLFGGTGATIGSSSIAGAGPAGDTRTWAIPSYPQETNFAAFKGNIIQVTQGRWIIAVDLLNGTIGQDVSLFISEVTDPGATPASPALLQPPYILDIDVEKRTISDSSSERFTLGTPIFLPPGLYVVAFVLDGPNTADVGVGTKINDPAPTADGIIDHYWGAEAAISSPATTSGGTPNVRWAEAGVTSMRIIHSRNIAPGTISTKNDGVVVGAGAWDNRHNFGSFSLGQTDSFSARRDGFAASYSRLETRNLLPAVEHRAQFVQMEANGWTFDYSVANEYRDFWYLAYSNS